MKPLTPYQEQALVMLLLYQKIPAFYEKNLCSLEREGLIHFRDRPDGMINILTEKGVTRAVENLHKALKEIGWE